MAPPDRLADGAGQQRPLNAAAELPTLLPRGLGAPTAAFADAAARGPRAAKTAGLVAGIVSAAVALAAPALDAFWTGVLTSPPLLATAVAWVLHRHGNAADAICFLHVYPADLVGRGAFAALVGAFVAERGIAADLALALGASLAIGRVGALQASRAPATIVLQESHRTWIL